MSSPTNSGTVSNRGLRLAISLALLMSGLGLAWTNRFDLIDWWRLQGYQAPPAVARLASQDTMTAYGRKVFYVNHPLIDAKSAFATACPRNGGERTIVLGCYHPGQAGIFLLDVNDPRLDGVEQVTAAHEMLHGAYERLSAKDRRQVDSMLLDYYDHELQDQRVIDTIAAYKKTEPKDLVNEMHSVFGTEIAQLPSGLEHYYARYFTDRGQVVAYAARYQGEFTSRQAVVAQDDAELVALKAEIERQESDLRAKQAEINDLQARLLAQKSRGDIDAYNAGVPGYNRLVDEYNAGVQSVTDLVERYNRLVDARNAVALEENELARNLNADVSPIRR